jgi:superoxide dismutase, Cu-Zn family
VSGYGADVRTPAPARMAVLASVLTLALAACGGDDEPRPAGEGAAAQGGQALTVELRGAEPGIGGTVELAEEDGAVRVTADVQGLEPGFHGFHVHEIGICDPDAREDGEPAPFSSAGGHFQGTGGDDHGEHAGDLPTLDASDNGRARLTVTTGRFTLQELQDSDGSAVMVHAMRDNQANVPERYETGGEAGPDADTLDTGDAGDRVACGIIER